MKLFGVYVPGRIAFYFLSEVALLFACFVLAIRILGYDVTLVLQYEDGFAQIGIATAMIVVGLYFRGLYSNVTRTAAFTLVLDVVQAVGTALLLQALLAYVYAPVSVPQRTMMIGSILVCALVPLWRILYTALTVHTMPGERILFLGSSDTVAAVASCLADHPEFGRVCGFVDDSLAEGSPLGGSVVLGPISSLQETIDRVRPQRLVVGMRERRGKLPVDELLHLRFRGLWIEEAANTYERVMGRVAIGELNPSHLIYSSALGPNPRILVLQMMYSIAIAAIGVVVALPAMLIVALLVRVTSHGPVLFRQERVGLYGKPFTLYKFRSMVVDAEARTGAVWATKNDSRVTPIGRWLRKLRLDELPQLINVLRGEMALVGPRPERPEFVRTLEEHIPFYPQRHYVRPGITGWAQINYKYGETMADTIIKLEYDLYYVKNLSPTLDFYCMFHTVKVMLLAEAGQ
jgi:sugar transferase (PEP-CTERM system associated)